MGCSYSNPDGDFKMPRRDDYGELTDAQERQILLDKLTRMLCSVCKKLEASGNKALLKQYVNIEVINWWEAHKKTDAARVLQEKEETKKANMKLKVLNKLSSEERKLLGL